MDPTACRRCSDALAECIRAALERYFDDLDGQPPCKVHDMAVKSVERTAIALVLEKTDGNQSLAAQMLGINRNTLRKKILEYQLFESTPS
ncbi:MAG: Fis family transcriptional regulator [Zoogloeaceae bacterium]|jgi:Fis family transcriptional regulator|nr:Fis family transcriptional regulator [Zoogloeaceae bacterium]